MERRSASVVRKGQMYRFTVAGTEYAAFIWQAGSQFCGRIEGNPQIPQCQARTVVAVRDALTAWLTKAATK